MIAVKTFGVDDNGSAASTFVGIPQPVGVSDGDLVVVAIALPASEIAVTPPDSSWTQLAQTDESLALGIAAFSHVALSDPPRYVFALSAACVAAGALVDLGGADAFDPVEVAAVAVTASSTSHTVAQVTSSMPGAEMLVLLAAAASGTYSPPAGYVEVARRQQAALTVEVQHRQFALPGTVAAFDETFSTAALGASVALVVRASQSTVSVDDVYRKLVAQMPPGTDEMLDFTPTGDFYKLFRAVASLLKTHAYDFVESLRSEATPHLSTYALDLWERFLGLPLPTALTTVPQRRARVLGGLRAMFGQGGSTDAVKAVLAPLLGYAATTLVHLVEINLSELQAAHTYQFGGFTVGAGATSTLKVFVICGDKVSSAGARLTLSGADTSGCSITLTAPDGTSFAWAAGTSADPGVLRAPALAGADLTGWWQLTVHNEGGAAVALTSASLLVDGVGADTGAAVFHWGALADAAHLGENGTPADLAGARAIVAKMAQSHTVASLLLSLSPYPDDVSGANAAIPDQCIPA